MNRRNFISSGLAAGITAFIPLKDLEALSSHDSLAQSGDDLMDKSDIIPAPDDPKQWEAWRNALNAWRKRKIDQLRYDGSSYTSDAFRWVSSNFTCGFIMLCDSDFYDPRSGKYKVRDLIQKGRSEFGGFDSVVLWHAYPRIGLDNRNQFDFYREMPGGLAAVREIVRDFHAWDTRVFIDYNPWDTGTRREKTTDIDALIEIIRSIDADGIFLDTMTDAPGFRKKLDEVKKGIVMEGEIALPLEHVGTHHMSWAQWFNDSNVPGVYRNKWFERHHMQHAIARWNTDRNPQLQTAWMNGSGILVWENIFGQLLEWNEKDKSTLRCMTSIQRRYGNLFTGESWIPLSDTASAEGIYISTWGTGDLKIKTLVNRLDKEYSGELFRIKNEPGMRWFDLVAGTEIHPESLKPTISIRGSISARGIGCFLVINRTRVDKDLIDFLARQHSLRETASEETKVTPVRIAAAKASATVPKLKKPSGMVIIPASSVTLKTEYRFREPGGYGNIQEHLELTATHKLHAACISEKNTDLKKFAIDKTPVTNALYNEFLKKSGYKPENPDNFLRHWKDGMIPQGMEDHPVVYIDINDAIAYAEWAGKRLPTEEEWQYAAQGKESLNYPWGNEMDMGRCNQNLNGETTEVNAFPSGASPFGCRDMCGNVWELTGRIYSDGRTRFVMLKGGSCYKAQGSDWYFDGGPQKNSFVAKMLLYWPGLDRCSTVGFRCAADI